MTQTQKVYYIFLCVSPKGTGVVTNTTLKVVNEMRQAGYTVYKLGRADAKLVKNALFTAGEEHTEFTKTKESLRLKNRSYKNNVNATVAKRQRPQH